MSISPPYFVGLLVQSVAFGGHLQLNVGPSADGRVPHPQVEVLQAMGRWLEVNGEAIWNTSGYPFGINKSCTTPAAPNKTLLVNTQEPGQFGGAGGEGAAGNYTMIAHTKAVGQVIHEMQAVSAAEAEAWCTGSSVCAGFDYYAQNDDGQPCGKQGAGGLGWLGCAGFKSAVAQVANDPSNTLYVKPGFKPGSPPPPPPPRQCYTKNPQTGAIYVMTNGWPAELVFPDGTLHADPAPKVSLLGLGHAAAASSGDYTVSTRGNATVIAVPVVSLADLPPASVSSSSFVFKLVGAEVDAQQ